MGNVSDARVAEMIEPIDQVKRTKLVAGRDLERRRINRGSQRSMPFFDQFGNIDVNLGEIKPDAEGGENQNSDERAAPAEAAQGCDRGARTIADWFRGANSALTCVCRPATRTVPFPAPLGARLPTRARFT